MATSRPFAYNKGPIISGTDQVGDLSIGTPISGFTTSPRFWNGPDEDFKYIIAHPTTSGTQPNPVSVSAYLGFWGTSAKTEELFIELSEYVSNYNGTPQTFATGDEAKTWLNLNGFWTNFGIGKRKILWWDIQNNSSYPSSGTTIYDLMSNVNGSFVGGVSFTSGSPKYLSCSNGTNYLRLVSGINSLLNPPDTGIEQSVLLWVYPTSNGVIFNEENPSGGWHDAQIQLVSGTMKFSVWPYTSIVTSSIATPLNNWYQVGYTYDGTNFKGYVNGQLAGSSTVSRQTPYNNGGGTQMIFNVGKTDSTNLGTNGTGANFRYGAMEIYNYGLTGVEVLSNYNSNKSIYGL